MSKIDHLDLSGLVLDTSMERFLYMRLQKAAKNNSELIKALQGNTGLVDPSRFIKLESLLVVARRLTLEAQTPDSSRELLGEMAVLVRDMEQS